jgi:tetratricopeptide (TPR) repeat protein
LSTVGETISSFRWGRRSVGWLLAGFVTVLISAAFWRWHPVHASSGKVGIGDLALVSNQLASRPAASRLSGPFDYREVAGGRRGAGEGLTDDLRLRAVAGRINAMLEGKPSPDNLHASGVALLLEGKAEKAAARFEETLRAETGEEQSAVGLRRSRDPELLADLSAAWIAEAEQSGRMLPLVAAIAAADRAVQLRPSLASASWNRALALAAFGDRDDARDAWDAYLRLDGDSAWAAEARRRRASLDGGRDEDLWPTASERLRAASAAADERAAREIVERFPTRAAGLVERELLPAWGLAVRRGDSDAARAALRTATGIAGAIADVTGDSLLKEVVRDADDRLAAVYASYGDLGAVFKRGGTSAVVVELRRLRDGLAKRRSAAASRFTLALAYRLYEQRQHTVALAELESFDDGALLKRYPLSLGQFYWYRGLAEASLGRANQAMESYGHAVTLFRELGDDGAAGSLELMRADAAEYAGDDDQAWDSYGAALRDIDRHGQASMHDVLMFAVARSALRRGYPDTALILQSRQVSRLRGTDKGPYLCQALIARCETLTVLGRAAGAKADCQQGSMVFSSIADAATRDRLQADLDLATASADASSSRSVAPLTSAMEVALRGNDQFRVARLYLARAKAFETLNSEREAEADLRAGIARVEQQRAILSTDEFRITWLDSWRGLYAELVSLLLRQERIEEAFEIADGSRSRVALERAGAAAGGSTLSALRARLPVDAAFVEFTLNADDGIVTWIVKRDSIVCRRFPARSAARRIQSCLLAYGTASALPPSDAAPEVLFDDFVRPWISDVAGSKTLVISPAGPLVQLPYAALRDRISGATLAASYTVVIAPSASLFLARKVRSGGPWSSALVVDNPSVDAARNLPELATRQEIGALRSLVQDVRVLRGDEATPDRFLSASAGSDVTHFAGHATDDASGDGALMMASDPEHRDGLLTGRQLGKSAVAHGSLVVLAACRTSRGRISSEGALSLARSFLLTGSAYVVGSLWDVDDAASDRLFAAFYHHLSQHTPAEALRLAQLDLSAIAPDPRYWAGFQVYGGN